MTGDAGRTTADPTVRGLTEAELAERLGVPSALVAVWRGSLIGPPCVRAGEAWFYRVCDVAAWLADVGVSTLVDARRAYETLDRRTRSTAEAGNRGDQPG